jgi:hypothetical protein
MLIDCADFYKDQSSVSSARNDAAIIVLTESHRVRRLAKLDAYGLDIGTAIEQGRDTALDAAGAVSMFAINDLPNPA